MKRTVSVVATCSFDFEIDDDVASEWDGAKILEVLERRRDADPPLYTEDATIETLLGGLGLMLCVENRTMGNFDGWADFPESAASGSPYGVDWQVEYVDVSPGASS